MQMNVPEFLSTSPEVRFALDSVRRAARLVARVQAELVSDAITKGDRSPVTVADYAAQALVGQSLAETFPDDPLVGEEDSSALRTDQNLNTLADITRYVAEFAPGATPERVCDWIDRGSAESGERYWTVDPIDGTKGFLRGMQYAVALALVEAGQVQIGALGCPNLDFEFLKPGDNPVPMQSPQAAGSLVLAVRGKGAWASSLDEDAFVKLQVSQRRQASQARLLRSYESAHTNTGQIGELVQAMDVQADPVAMDSQAKYAVLAAGRGDMLVRLLSARQPDYREKVWDQAAGSIVVEEAGGKISDLHGRPLDFTRGRTLAGNRGVLASNGYLHRDALLALAQIGA